jgi:O-acetyl-ADP-ribose deacetylase (regulator of RNase III)
MKITHSTGNILNSRCDVLLLPAPSRQLQFGDMTPAVARRYKEACRMHYSLKKPSSGTITVVNYCGAPALFFANIKRRSGRSTLHSIRRCYAAMVRLVKKFKVKSIAVPLLGVEFGGFTAEQIRPLRDMAIACLPKTCERVSVYEPKETK